MGGWGGQRGGGGGKQHLPWVPGQFGPGSLVTPAAPQDPQVQSVRVAPALPGDTGRGGAEQALSRVPDSSPRPVAGLRHPDPGPQSGSYPTAAPGRGPTASTLQLGPGPEAATPGPELVSEETPDTRPPRNTEGSTQIQTETTGKMPLSHLCGLAGQRSALQRETQTLW